MKNEISEKLLELMREKSYAPRTLQELSSMLGLRRKDNSKLKKTLSKLLGDGSIAKVKGDRYGVSADLDLVAGIIEFRQSGRAVLRTGNPYDDIEIRREDTGVALNGDKVLARILASRSRGGRGLRGGAARRSEQDARDDRKYAKVIRILDRKNTKVVGTLRRSYNVWHVVPDDPKFFYDIIVADPAASGVFPIPKADDKLVVRLNEWTQRHINPSGEIIENLGQSHTPMAEYRGILVKYDLRDSFPDAVLKEISGVPSAVSAKDRQGRLDIRNLFTITIDPEDAKDFDDAVSIEPAGEGLWEVGVHIADVAHYVRPGSAIDLEARARGNSTYLVGTVIPMLPFELSNGICSLVENEDRLVKSVFLKFDAAGDCKGVRFANSVMRSSKRLSYEQAHAFLVENDLAKIAKVRPPADYETAFAGKNLDSLSASELAKIQSAIRQMWNIASALRNKRMKKGSLDFELPEFKIFCNAEGYADRIEKISYDESHQLIEEFMLAANEAVARELFWHHIPFVSRVHDKPEADKLIELRAELAGFGIKCGDLSSRRELIRVLAEISKHTQSYYLKTRFLRSLKRAEYRASPDGHYGLNKVYYSHFTSPIRRYSDLLSHRAINWLLRETSGAGAPKSQVQLPNKAALEQIAADISRTEQNSADAERESRKIKLMEFFERKIDTGESFEAVIESVSNHGFFVELTQSMAYGFVHVHNLRDDFYHVSGEGGELRGRRTGETFKTGDKVRVEVESVDRFKRQIDFRLAASSDSASRAKKRRKRNS